VGVPRRLTDAQVPDAAARRRYTSSAVVVTSPQDLVPDDLTSRLSASGIFNPSIHRLAKPADGDETDEEPPFTLPDGRAVIRWHRFLERELIKQVNTSELVYYVTHPDGRQERLVHRLQMRCIFRFEAEHLLARAGFTVEHVYADFSRAPYGSQYPGELIFVARLVAPVQEFGR